MCLNDTRMYYRDSNSGLTSEITTSLLIDTNTNLTNSGLTYGGILCDNLFPEINSEIVAPTILEIGGGYGNVAWNFAVRLFEKHRRGCTYICLDYSPFFLASQKNALGNYYYKEFIQADAHNIPIKPNSVDLVIVSEVIGDLLTLEHRSNTYWNDEAQRLLAIAKITDKGYPINVGALRLVEEISSILGPGGVAFVSEHSCEYSTVNGSKYFPLNVDLHGHIEYNIKFSWLCKLASAFGLVAYRGKLYDFIELRKDTKEISPTDLLEIMTAYKLDYKDFELFCSLLTNPAKLKKIIGRINFKDVSPFYHSMWRNAQFEYLILKKS